MGKPLYTAVWKKSTESEQQVYGRAYEDFRKKYDELRKQGWIAAEHAQCFIAIKAYHKKGPAVCEAILIKKHQAHVVDQYVQTP